MHTADSEDSKQVDFSVANDESECLRKMCTAFNKKVMESGTSLVQNTYYDKKVWSEHLFQKGVHFKISLKEN